jgi:FtsP/CotA-like multicopper oxidase with cupredoxin domain
MEMRYAEERQEEKQRMLLLNRASVTQINRGNHMNKLYLLIVLLFVVGVLMSSCSPQQQSSMMQPANGHMMHSDSRMASTLFSQAVDGLQDAAPSAIMVLKDGDTIQLTADIVKKAINGKEVRMFGYNGQIPGPLLKVKKGSTLWVEFTNNLDIETTIHWHGIRVENEFDGVPGVTQPAVQPGESFRYKLTFPDEGMFWYHPHLREDYQQELGLYGNILVEDEGSIPSVNREEPVFVDDISLTQDGIVPFYEERITHALMGRFGNTMLLNGKTDYQLVAKKGEAIRLYFTNAANTRTFNIAIPGAKMKLVGGDQGAYEQEQFVESFIFSPSERVVVDVYFEKAGTFSITHTTPARTYKIGEIVVSQSPIETSFKQDFFELHASNNKKEFDGLRAYTTKDPDATLRLDFSVGGMGMRMSDGSASGIEWEDPTPQMNAMMTNISAVWFFEDAATKKRNMDIAYTWKVGDKVKIRLFNDPNTMHPMQHPIHFHGQRFVVLSVNSEPNQNMVWKDTVLVPVGATVDILLEISNPGDWMAHCHIAEHLQAGMMSLFTVV